MGNIKVKIKTTSKLIVIINVKNVITRGKQRWPLGRGLLGARYRSQTFACPFTSELSVVARRCSHSTLEILINFDVVPLFCVNISHFLALIFSTLGPRLVQRETDREIMNIRLSAIVLCFDE